VRLDIVDRTTGSLFFTKLVYTLELRDYEQPYINSPDVAVAGGMVSFDGLKSYLPGYEILNYSWDFGEEARMEGASTSHTFKVKGEYNVNLGLTLKSKTTGIIDKTGVTKKITIVNDNQERTAYLAKKALIISTLPDIRKFNNASIKTEYSAEEDFPKDALFSIILLSSKARIGLNSSTFRNLPDKYSLKEVFDKESGIYSYIADEQMTLMATYPSLRELYGLGFKNVQIKLSVIKDHVERELLILKKNYGILTDNYFDSNGQLKSSAYLMLDQIVMLMNQNPNLRFEVGVHTDNLGYAASNLTISQTRAQLLVNYLINRGISSKRLVARGYGGVKPVTSNILEKDRRLNRRVDFRIIN
jgi:flagellar motor protein MotB